MKVITPEKLAENNSENGHQAALLFGRVEYRKIS